MPKIGRNEPCPCGSGKKYKKCCERLETTSLPNIQTLSQEPSISLSSILPKYIPECSKVRRIDEINVIKYSKQIDYILGNSLKLEELFSK